MVGSSGFHLAHTIDLWYSDRPTSGTSSMIPVSGILNDESPIQGIIPVWIEKAFLAAKSGSVQDPFDLFGAVFFMLSRCEEYGFDAGDQWNRFPAKASAAWKHGVLSIPVVDCWLTLLAGMLNKANPKGSFRLKKVVPPLLTTFDIDRAYAYKYRGLIVQSGAVLKKLKSGKWKEAKYVFSLMIGKVGDPWDTYTKLSRLHRLYHLQPLFFMLVNQPNEWPRALGYKDKVWRTLVTNLDKEGIVGLHPSIEAGMYLDLLSKEKNQLENILQRSVTTIRQHFITLKFPSTYRLYRACGFNHDYSMGYPDCVGYRAGTGRSFYFFDVETNTPSSLLITPFVAMDTTLRQYMKYSPVQAIEAIVTLAREALEFQTPCSLLFHNESIGGFAEWEGWEDVYADCLKSIESLHQKHYISHE